MRTASKVVRQSPKAVFSAGLFSLGFLSLVSVGAIAQNSPRASSQNSRETGVEIALAEDSSAEEPTAEETSEICEFPELSLPEDFVVYATGAYSGKKLDYQIDQSGHRATQIDVVANSSTRPVVLMLGAYEPTIWNLQWTQETEIVGVVVSGYHRQAVAGLPEATPILNSTYENEGACGYFDLTPESYPQLNPLARQLFNQPVEMIFPLDETATAVVGTPLSRDEIASDEVALVSSEFTPVESFFDPNAPLAGQAGLDAAVASGLLRLANEEDMQRWHDAQQVVQKPEADIPPIDGQGSGQDAPTVLAPDLASASMTFARTYVVLNNDFVFPAGLYGAHSVSFILPEGVEMPAGNPGHSTIFSLDTAECLGVLCRM